MTSYPVMQLPVMHVHVITSGTPTHNPHKYGLSCAYILLEGYTFKMKNRKTIGRKSGPEVITCTCITGSCITGYDVTGNDVTGSHETEMKGR
jgi:hypothetical protein